MTYTGKSKYFEIKERIEEKINSGEFLTGENLPSEPKLSEIFNASRGTVRQALSALEREGVIARRSGIGTQVVRRPKPATILSFSHQAEEKGMTPSARLLGKSSLTLEQAPGRCSEAFWSDHPETESILCIERLRYANDHPVVHQTIFLRMSDFQPSFLQTEDFKGSMFAVYEKYHRRAAWADEIIRARRPAKEELDMLEMAGLPELDQMVYERNRITYDDENMPLEVLISVERADFFGSYQYRLLSDGSR